MENDIFLVSNRVRTLGATGETGDTSQPRIPRRTSPWESPVIHKMIFCIYSAKGGFSLAWLLPYTKSFTSLVNLVKKARKTRIKLNSKSHALGKKPLLADGIFCINREVLTCFFILIKLHLISSITLFEIRTKN